MGKKDFEQEHFKIDEDPRFTVCFKEALLTFGFYSAFFLVVMISMYSLSDDLLFGFPRWFLVSGILAPVAFIGILIYLVEKVFQDTPLDPTLNEGGDE